MRPTCTHSPRPLKHSAHPLTHSPPQVNDLEQNKKMADATIERLIIDKNVSMAR